MTEPAEPDPEVATLVNERLATNLRTERERQRMSQADLARKMADQGWPYYPQTIHRIESGQRKVTLGEAWSLASILKTTIDRLAWPTREASAQHLLIRSTVSARRAYRAIANGTAQLLHSQGQLELTLSEVERSPFRDSERLRGPVEEAREILVVTPEQAVMDGREELESLHDDEDDEDQPPSASQMPAAS